MNYVKQSDFNRNPTYEPMWLKTYMTYMFKNITEVVYVRSFQDDKFESKFVEVDYEIPPKVGMTNYTHSLCDLCQAKQLYPQSNL